MLSGTLFVCVNGYSKSRTTIYPNREFGAFAIVIAAFSLALFSTQLNV